MKIGWASHRTFVDSLSDTLILHTLAINVSRNLPLTDLPRDSDLFIDSA